MVSSGRHHGSANPVVNGKSKIEELLILPPSDFGWFVLTWPSCAGLGRDSVRFN